jgi:nitrite reductase/ring-hydroxylating ferredoxin subunit/DMSO/TMAO reductase YedYZ heme-binding membrane subunit
VSVGFRAVQWNRHKLIYDAALLAGVAFFITCFMVLAPRLWPGANDVTWDILRIRAFGICAFVMLTIILAIGPLARLDRRFLPLLYNRRHFGVVTFCVAALHAWYVLGWYHSDGKLPMLVSLLVSSRHYVSFIDFPFELLGLAAFLVLFLMAATSHDYWLAFLTPPVWKALHMAVYPAYGVLVLHVALGAMQTERSPIIPVLLGGAFAVVAALHIIADRRERRGRDSMAADGWLSVGPPLSISDGRARMIAVSGAERIAVFRDGSRIGALSNVCAHQNGPLGEGRLIDGCVTCPWHGFQYRLDDGCSPPPFAERVATYRVRIRDGMVEVHPEPMPLGTKAVLAVIDAAPKGEADATR